MIKKIFLISLTLISGQIISGALFDTIIRGNGTLKKETRLVNNFDKISVSGAITVAINCQNKKKLDLEGDANILPILTTAVIGKVLNIGTNKKYKENIPLKIYISIPDINKIEFNGSSKVIIDNIKNKKLEVLANGNNDLTASGSSKELSLNVMGSGYIDTKNLISEKATVDVKGASIVDVYSNKDLNLKISGFGKINYYGNPKNVKKEISGSGLIIQAKK